MTPVSYTHLDVYKRQIQDNVKSAVESMTGLEVSAINVNVGGITFPPKA